MCELAICLGQINPVVGDMPGNTLKIIDCIDKARTKGADMVVLPELSLCGYPPEDLLLKPYFIKENQRHLLRVIKATKEILVILGFPYSEKGNLYNAAALINNRKLIDVYKKVHLPNYGVFDERRYFTPGESCPVLQVGNRFKIGVSICEDIWHANGPQKIQSKLGGARVLVNISASPYHAGKVMEREKLLQTIARENHVYVCYCNLIGGQDELVFDGGSLVYDDKGKLLARAKQFAEDFLLVMINIDGKQVKDVRTRSEASFDLPGASLKTIIIDNFRKKPQSFSSNRIEKQGDTIDEIYGALLLGLKDYVDKNHFTKAVLGLSGGIDSAVTAALAVAALGKENLVALTMPSRYSSPGSKRDARRVASNLNVKLITLPIDKVCREYLSLLRECFKGKKEDVTEENIQARVRGNLLMALSNKFGWLVITTGNKSEVSTGYCTLYGDMAGGFSILKDVPKGLVYKLAKYVNKRARQDIFPRSILQRVPSAELKRRQNDLEVLPPYPVLDKIMDLYVMKDMSFPQIIRKGYKRQTVSQVIQMIDKNEYKRKQAPPGIKITPKAFGKDRRMPITNAFSYYYFD